MYRFIGVGLLILLVAFGCRVKENEVTVSVKDLREAIAGKTVMVDFEAEITLPMTMEQVSQKFQLEEIKKILNQYLELDDYEIEKGDIMGTKIEIEGKLPLLIAKSTDMIKSSTKSAWAIAVIPLPKDPTSIFSKYDYIVSLATTENFLPMNKSLKNINFMLGTEKIQPLKVKLKNSIGKSVDLFAGPIEIEGVMQQYFPKSLDSGKLRFEMKGGIYNYVQPSFMLKIHK